MIQETHIHKSDLVEYILNVLEQKSYLSDLEKDILSSCNKFIEAPFDRKGTTQKIVENNMRYPEIFVAIRTLPGMESRPFCQVSDEAVKHNLFMQIEGMWARRVG